MTVMYATISHADGYEQSYACAYPENTPVGAYLVVLAHLLSSGAHPVGDEAALTITTHTPTAQVVRQFTGGSA